MAQPSIHGNIRELDIDKLEGTAAGRRVVLVISVPGGRLFVDYEPAFFGGPLIPNCNFVPRGD
jgi:hypothetical protein